MHEISTIVHGYWKQGGIALRVVRMEGCVAISCWTSDAIRVVPRLREFGTTVCAFDDRKSTATFLQVKHQ